MDYYIYKGYDWRQTISAFTASAGTGWTAQCNLWNGDSLVTPIPASVLANGLVLLELGTQAIALILDGTYRLFLSVRNLAQVEMGSLEGVVIVLTLPVGNDTTPVPVVIVAAIDSAIATHNSNPAAHPGLVGGGGSPRRDAFTPSNSQTVFTLTATPALPHLSSAYLNAGKARYGADYTINGLILTWSGLGLETSDRFEIYYT